MVDFDNEVTVGTPAVDVQRITVLQRRYDLFEALEQYNKESMNGLAYPLSYVKARLFTFYLEVQPMLQRHLSKEEYDKVHNFCTQELSQSKKEDLLELIMMINKVLDHPVRLTRLDNTKQYDSQNMEEENAEKGY